MSTGSSSPSASLFCAMGAPDMAISDDELQGQLQRFLKSVGDQRDDILLLPPDYTRFHSYAGPITRMIAEYYNIIPSSSSSSSVESSSSSKNAQSTPASFQILPALGTHAPMTMEQIESMFGEPLAQKASQSGEGDQDLFLVHDWRSDVETIGHVPASMVEEATHGYVKDQAWPAQLNKVVWDKRKHKQRDGTGIDSKPLILSIGQVVPHEVMGMANYNKNLFVGVGGVEAINLSHFIGAVHGMERMMGQASNPLRDILHYASDHFLHDELDLWYILTVMGRRTPTDSDEDDEDDGALEMKGLFIGNDIECYNQACDLSLKVNFTLLDRPPKTMVTYLDPDEFHSTWLGNKAIYRTRMAIADGGHLIVLAPGVRRFGEDDTIDALIRQYGYKGTEATLQVLKDDPDSDFAHNLSAVAHLIHGSSEGRFRITYCCEHLTRAEVEQVGFEYAPLDEMLKTYDITKLKDGWNQSEGNVDSDFFYISNPALGLWAVPERFHSPSSATGDSQEKGADVGPNLSVAMDQQNGADGSGGVGGWAKPPQPE